MSRTTRLLLFLAIVIVLLMRLSLAVTRYFDADEFAHLHWSYLITQGFVPYRDFFMNFTPLFNWFLSPLLSLPASPNLIIAARIIQWLVIAGIALGVGLLGLRAKFSPQSIFLAILVFLVFPITLDKTIEVRADSLMTLLFLSSVLATYAIGRYGRRGAWASGFLASLSVLLLTKAVILIPALLVVLILEIRGAKNWKTLLAWWIIGVLTPILPFFAILAWQGILPAAIAQIVAGSIAIKQGEGAFSPFLPLGPYPIIYDGMGGAITIPWIASTLCWVFALVGLARLLRQKHPFGVFVAWFLGGSIVGLFLFPTPYVQYFIPASAVASVLAGFAINKNITVINFIIVITVISSFFLQYRERMIPGANNKEQLQVIRDILSLTRPNETVYDMVGSYVFRPDGHPICCNEYARFGKFLPFPVPTLAETLVTRRTKFIILDRLGKSLWLPAAEDLTFIVSNYLPTKYNKIYSLGVEFRCQNGACMPPGANRSTNFFTILVPEKYVMTLEPNTANVTIDGKEMRSGQTLDLASGPHRFSVTPILANFRIQIAR